MARGFYLKFLRRLREVDAAVRARFFALAAEEAVFDVQHRFLRDGRGKGHTNGAVRAKPKIKGGGQVDRTGIFALAAAGTGFFVHVARFLQHLHLEAARRCD